MHELQRECDYCHHDVLFLGTRRRQNISFSFRPATLPKLLTILIFFFFCDLFIFFFPHLLSIQFFFCQLQYLYSIFYFNWWHFVHTMMAILTILFDVFFNFNKDLLHCRVSVEETI